MFSWNSGQAFRDVLGLYDRPRDMSLGVPPEYKLNNPEVELRRDNWKPYLTGEVSTYAPLAVRFIPLLLVDINHSKVGWPATLYPLGFRQQVLTHCGLSVGMARRNSESLLNESLRIFDSDNAHLKSQVRDSEGALRVRIASALNVASLYATTVEVMGGYATRDLAHPHLTYELARATYQMYAGRRGSHKFFEILTSEACPSLGVRLNSLSRLIAHFARAGKDLSECAEWVYRGENLIAWAPIPEATDFGVILAVSRVHRAVALYAARRHDWALLKSKLRMSLEVSEMLQSICEDEIDEIAVLQNERLIREAALKAFALSRGQVAPLDPQTCVDRLVLVDPNDPYVRMLVGDVLWMLSQDVDALESYAAAVAMGTLPGAYAAYKAAQMLTILGRTSESSWWLQKAIELDPAAGLSSSNQAEWRRI